MVPHAYIFKFNLFSFNYVYVDTWIYAHECCLVPIQARDIKSSCSQS